MKRLPMRKIRDVLRLSAEGLSTRQIEASLATGRSLPGPRTRGRPELASAAGPVRYRPRTASGRMKVEAVLRAISAWSTAIRQTPALPQNFLFS